MLKGEAKKDYQREYMRRYRMGLTGSNTGSNKEGLTGSNKSIEARLKEQGLTVGKGGVLDLTSSKSSPLKEESNTTLPRYNPAIHKPGDKVLVLRGKRWLPYLVPEIDKDGYTVPDYW